RRTAACPRLRRLPSAPLSPYTTLFRSDLPRERSMAKERLSMRKTREILREKWELGLSHRAVMRILGVSLGMVSNTVARAQAAGLRTWAEVEALSDEALEERL